MLPCWSRTKPVGFRAQPPPARVVGVLSHRDGLNSVFRPAPWKLLSGRSGQPGAPVAVLVAGLHVLPGVGMALSTVHDATSCRFDGPALSTVLLVKVQVLMSVDSVLPS